MPWVTSETVVHCSLILFFPVWTTLHILLHLSFYFSFLTDLISLFGNITQCLLHARHYSAAPCSLETYHLVKKVNKKQLKREKPFAMNMPKQQIVRDPCTTVVGGEGRSLHEDRWSCFFLLGPFPLDSVPDA